MNLIELDKELKDFDYFYEHSDDHSEWKKGIAESERIQKAIDDMVNTYAPSTIKKVIKKYYRVDGHRFELQGVEV